MVNRRMLFFFLFIMTTESVLEITKKSQFVTMRYLYLLKRKLTQTAGIKFSSNKGFPSLGKDLEMPSLLFALTLPIRSQGHWYLSKAATSLRKDDTFSLQHTLTFSLAESTQNTCRLAPHCPQAWTAAMKGRLLEDGVDSLERSAGRVVIRCRCDFRDWNSATVIFL